MSSELRKWFEAEKEDESITRNDISIFEHFVDEELQADDALSQLIIGKTTRDKEQKRSQVFHLIINIAQDFPDFHERLIVLLKALFADDEVDPTGFGWELRATHDGIFLRHTSS
jgi:hypothetical protein